MIIKDYKRYILELFANSIQFAEIQNLLIANYGIKTFPNNWIDITQKDYNFTTIVNIAIVTDFIDEIDKNIQSELQNKICNLCTKFATEIYNKFANKIKYFKQVATDTKIETSCNYGALIKSSADNGDFIYLMLTEF